MAAAVLLCIRNLISQPGSLHLLIRQQHWHPVMEPAAAPQQTPLTLKLSHAKRYAEYLQQDNNRSYLHATPDNLLNDKK